MDLLSIVISIVTVYIMILLNLDLAFKIRKVEDQLREAKAHLDELESHYSSYIDKNDYSVNAIKEELELRRHR